MYLLAWWRSSVERKKSSLLSLMGIQHSENCMASRHVPPVPQARPASRAPIASACQASQPALTTAASPDGPDHGRRHERRQQPQSMGLPGAAAVSRRIAKLEDCIGSLC